MSKPPRERPLLQASSAQRLAVWLVGLLAAFAIAGVYLVTSTAPKGKAPAKAALPLEEPHFEGVLEHRRRADDEASTGDSSSSSRCPTEKDACDNQDKCFWVQSGSSGNADEAPGWECQHEDEQSSHIYVPEGILGGFVTLAAGACILQVFSGLPIPYTVLLLLMGMALGGLVLARGLDDRESWSANVVEFYDGIWLFARLDAHLLLHIFLPPLIFESAFAVEWHVFEQLKWYCVVLAVPGLITATYATGGLINLMLMPAEDDRWFKPYYDASAMHNGTLGVCADDAWSEMSGYLLGVILSATDPVAVVALLKELGVKAELSIGIEGESLLNDGTALVIFAVLQKTVESASSLCIPGKTLVGGVTLNASDPPLGAGVCEGHTYDYTEHWLEPGACIWQFVYMAVIGGIFGLGMAFVLVAWISKVFNDAMVEITLTLTFAYLTFFLAEHFKMSGVLAVVVLGIYMGKNGRTRISPEVEHFLNEFWELLAYFGNTLIFVIAGIMIVADLGYECGAECKANLPTDVWQLLVLYVGCTLLRLVLVYAAYALMNFSGLQRMPWKDGLVATWGGLRGAVGLACAILVFKNPDICEHVRRKVMFHTSGICVLTVLVNGVTMRYLIQALGMDKMTPAKAQMFSQALRQIDRAGQKREQTAMKEAIFENVVWEVARSFYVKEEDLREDLHAPRHRGGGGGGGGGGELERSKSGRRSIVGLGRDSIGLSKARSSKAARDSRESKESKESKERDEQAPGIVEVRRRILMRCKQCYWNQLEAGLIQRDAAKYLRRITDLCVNSQCSLGEWDLLKQSLSDKEKWETDAMQEAEAKRASWRRRLHDFLNTVGWTLFVMIVVIVSVVFGLQEDIQEMAFIESFDLAVMIFFILELLARAVSSSSAHAFITDPYCLVDLMVVLLDLGTTLSAEVSEQEETVGNVSSLPRLVRVLRTLRLLKGLRLLSASKKGATSVHAFQGCVNSLDRTITYLTRRFSWLSWLLVVQQRMTVGHFEMEHNVVSGFLAAREEAVEMVPQFLGEIQGLELDDEFQQLVQRLHIDVERAHAALQGLRTLNSEAYASITTVIAARSVLHRQQKAVHKLVHEGMLDSKEVQNIDGAIEKSMKRLVFSPPYIPLPGSPEVLRQVHWTHPLSEAGMATLLAACEEKHYYSGQVVVEQGATDDAVYIVKHGTLLKQRTMSEGEAPELAAMTHLHMGHSFNEIAWMLGQPSQHTVKAAQEVDCLRVTGGVMRQLAAAEPEMGDALWLTIGSKIAMVAITQHALEDHGALLAPWQLARIMRTIRMHKVGGSGDDADAHETHTFHAHATVILVSGGASLIKKTRLERAADSDVGAEFRRSEALAAALAAGGGGGVATKAAPPAAAAAEDGGAADGGGADGRRASHVLKKTKTWALVRRAAEHRADEMVRYEAPCIVPPLAAGHMFRIAFDAGTRFACDEDGIYVPPRQSALVRLTTLAHQVLANQKQLSNKREKEKEKKQERATGFFGRKSIFGRNSSREPSRGDRGKPGAEASEWSGSWSRKSTKPPPISV